MIEIIVLLLTCAPFVWWYFVLRKYASLNVIPGPNPLPLIGNAYDVGSTPQALFNNCLKFFNQYGDVFKIYIANELKVFIAKPELLEQIMSSTTHITKSDGYYLLKKWLNVGLLLSTGKKWRIRRRMITPTFHFKILDEFLEIFNSCGDILVRKLAKEVGKDCADLSPYINLFALDVICETAMGVKISSQEGKNKEYTESVDNLLNIFIGRFFSSWKKFDSLFKFSSDYEAHEHSLNILHKFSDNVISKRRQERSQQKFKTTASDDGIKPKIALLDTLLEAEDNNTVTMEGIKEEINTFMFEGHDTTTSGISFAMIALADNPEVQEKVYDEIVAVVGEATKYVTMQHLQDTKYLDMVVKEVQRMYPPVPFVERRLETSFNMGGIEFPKDTTLTLYIYGAHQNEKYFPEPHKFDPNRFLSEKQAERHNYAYVPFSAGPRNCIGQKFAVFDMKAAIIKILQKFRLLPVPNYKPELGMAAVLKSYNGICVRLENR